jgi:ABC-2 type transport system permease protein
MRDTSRPLPFAPAARAVFDLSLEGMVWTRRSLLMALLVTAPVAFAILYRVVLAAKTSTRPVTPPDLYAVIVVAYWLMAILPLTALFFATSLVADEVEGRTLTYLVTRPLTRGSIFAGKFAAYLATTFCLALPAGFLTFFILLSAHGWSGIAPSVGDLFRDVSVMALALLAYGASFALLGVLLKRPVLAGLAFLGLEFFMSRLPGHLPRFTITAWVTSLVHHRPAQEGLAGLFQQIFPAGQSLAVLVGVSAVFLAAAAWIFSTREYVLDQ